MDTKAPDAAILLISMGEEEAAEVLPPHAQEAQKLGEKMARTEDDPARPLRAGACCASRRRCMTPACSSSTPTPMCAGDAPRAGGDKANLLIDRIVRVNDAPGIDNLKWMDPAAVADLLRREHPQIVAVILVHLRPEQVSEVLRRFPEGHRNG